MRRFKMKNAFGLRNFILRFYGNLRIFGLDPLMFMKSISGLRFYISDYFKLRKQKSKDKSFPFGRSFPVLDERTAQSGIMFGHYFHQDLFVAREIFRKNPRRHIDIGSRTDGFIAHVSVFREIEIIDIRKQTEVIENISFRQADLMSLPVDMTNTYDSVSSLHAIEHFGLGRYGDPIDYLGHVKAVRNIAKMLLPGGIFYFSVPIGPQRIEFNAHRVFSVRYLIDLLTEDFAIESFSYVDDEGRFHEKVPVNDTSVGSNYGCKYGCGIFVLKKL